MSRVKACTHLDSVREVAPSGRGCVECLRQGDTWVHLRLCRVCGHVGCCDDSKNRHARQHFVQTGHAIMSSFEPGENWSWCFADKIEVDVTGGNTARKCRHGECISHGAFVGPTPALPVQAGNILSPTGF